MGVVLSERRAARRVGARLAAVWVAALLLGGSDGLPAGGAVTRAAPPRASSPATARVPRLPGQQYWKDGVSSYLFGATDDVEWGEHNFETDPALQQAVKRAGFTLIRTLFPDGASDFDVEQRISTVENTGAACLGVITNMFDYSWDEHLVRYLGDRCLMYEFGGEPNYHGVSLEQFLTAWNREIPVLRRINPKAKFFGPTTGGTPTDFLAGFFASAKAAGTLPDAVSIDYYPCWKNTREQCLANADFFRVQAERLRAIVHQSLGEDLPIGFTEWNYDPANPPPAYGDDPAFMTDFTTRAIRAMISAGVEFAAQFDLASYSGYGRLDMFDLATDRPKPQYYAMAALIRAYRPDSAGGVGAADRPGATARASLPATPHDADVARRPASV